MISLVIIKLCYAWWNKHKSLKVRKHIIACMDKNLKAKRLSLYHQMKRKKLISQKKKAKLSLYDKMKKKRNLRPS